MNIRAARTWAIASAILTAGTMLFAVLGAAILDTLVRRSTTGGSITTMFPGFVYASATAMKVGLVAGVASAVLAIIRWVTAGAAVRATALPIYGIAAISLTAATPLMGALAVVIVQALADKPPALPAGDLSEISRTAVFVSMSVIAGGVLLALRSLERRERPVLLAVLGLAVNALLIGLFWHFEFYAYGFDQDTWAPR